MHEKIQRYRLHSAHREFLIPVVDRHAAFFGGGDLYNRCYFLETQAGHVTPEELWAADYESQKQIRDIPESEFAFAMGAGQ